MIVADVPTKRNHALIYREIPGFIRALRTRAGMTQVELASKLRESQVYVTRCESGSRRVDVAEFIQIAKALGLDPVEVFAELVGRR